MSNKNESSLDGAVKAMLEHRDQRIRELEAQVLELKSELAKRSNRSPSFEHWLAGSLPRATDPLSDILLELA